MGDLLQKNNMEYKKKKGEVWLNLGSGVSLSSDFINVDNYFTLEDLKQGQKSKEGNFKNARVTKDTKFVKADIFNLPFKDNYADYIECNDTIEHQPIRSIGKFLSEIYRVLKPGGKLCMSTTNFDELARLWTINITGSKFNKTEDWERYMKLSQVIYGNQASAGEYHKVPFNPIVMAYHLQVAKFKAENIVIEIFPTNSPSLPPQLAYKHMRGDMTNTVVLTEMMWVTAIK